ncbi:hypothetical protein ACLKA6_017141 [Drosophila palustris]
MLRNTTSLFLLLGGVALSLGISITPIVREDLMKDDYLYWTSGNDMAETGRHVWFGNGHPIGVNIWALGQPDNGAGLEHCDHIGYRRVVTDKKGLNDNQCSTKLRFICEVPQPYTASFVIWK